MWFSNIPLLRHGLEDAGGAEKRRATLHSAIRVGSIKLLSFEREAFTGLPDMDTIELGAFDLYPSMVYHVLGSIVDGVLLLRLRASCTS
mmetsp:Transcript_86836/g.151153  ORF Transcript_86836/g.151153 Transcript_86836/m.151153 type:complete len:89 (-) Transcript_86836:2132-2398(-)